MYARVTTFTAKSGKLVEVIRGVRGTMPNVKMQKGMIGGYLLTDKKKGKCLVVGLWDTEADLKAGESSAHINEAMAKFGPLVAGPITQEDYEVSSQA